MKKITFQYSRVSDTGSRGELTPDYSQPRGLGIFGVDEIFPGFPRGFIFY